MNKKSTKSTDSELIGKNISCNNNYFASSHYILSNYKTRFFIPAIGVTAQSERTDLNWQDADGNTILHNMVRNNANIEVIKKVHELGAEIDIKNNKNKTPIDIANKNDNIEVATHLYNSKFNEDKTKIGRLAYEHVKMENHTNRWRRSNYLQSILEEHKNLNSNYQEVNSDSSYTNSTCSETSSYGSVEDNSFNNYLSTTTNHTERLTRSYQTARSR